MGVATGSHPKGFDKNLRLSDGERADALARLSFCYGEGRLDLDEYERRCGEVGTATTHGDLAPLFSDLPAAMAETPSTAVEPFYTKQQLERFHANGKNIKLGMFGLGSIGALVLALIAGPGLGSEVAFLASLAIIPVLFILLYVMKIGPEDWHAPSPRELERQQLREIRHAQKLEIEQRRAKRKEQTDKITGDALEIAQNAISRFRG